MSQAKLVAALAVASAALALASCSISLGPLTDSPPATGSTASNPSHNASTAGVLGGALGADLGEGDRQRAYAAEVQALEFGEPGAPTGWKGAVPTHHGTVVPGANYQARGTRCRDFSHTIYIDGRPQTARGTACRNPDGTWSPVG